MKASELILDLLRTYGRHGTSVRQIAESGALFGFTANSIRVNLSRLVRKGAIELLQRGQYRLCESAAAVNDFAESWRLGEQRVKPWDEANWSCIHTVKHNDKDKWALTNIGYRAIKPDFWVRPDNLSTPSENLLGKLHSLGLSRSSVMISNGQLTADLQDQWISHFDLQQIETAYLDTIQALQDSLRRIEQLPRNAARKETFALGGRGIEILAKDPLIPERYLSSSKRKQLWEVLIRYDAAGRKVWATQDQPMPEALVTPNSKLMSN